ncbi:MAG: hypothetical protein NXI27_19935 [Alphaproteobacteria bacterium]|nr:hypothetical protein [Alphaproteobacteria bacterium]
MRTYFAGLIAIVASLLIMSEAGADDSAIRGQAVVEQWCRTCHVRPTDRANADMAPPFEAIVQRPGRDRAYFEKFLWEDHFPMTTYRLFDSERFDVVAYLMFLQESN